MVLLTAGLRPANPREIKLQCLEGWGGLVAALATEAPLQLGGIVNQVRPEACSWSSSADGWKGCSWHGFPMLRRLPCRPRGESCCCRPPAPQVVVALMESLQEGGAVSAAAIKVRRAHEPALCLDCYRPCTAQQSLGHPMVPCHLSA